MKKSIVSLSLILISFASLAQKKKDYDIKFPFDNDYQIVQKKNRFGLIDEDGGFVTPIKYTQIYYYNHLGLAKVEINDTLGYINEIGDELITCEYNRIYEKFASISKPRYEKVNGEMVEYVQAIYMPIVENDLVLLQKGNKIGMMNLKSKRIDIPFEYDFLIGRLPYNNTSQSNKKWNYYGDKEQGYNGIGSFYYSLFDKGIAAMVKGGPYLNGGLLGFVNYKGQELTEFTYNGFITFEKNGIPYFVNDNDHIAVIKDNKAGLIDVTGEEIIPLKYDVVYNDENYMNFINGIAAVQFKGLIGFVNEDGKEIISPKYKPTDDCKDCYKFRNGFAIVNFAGDLKIIDRNGQNITKSSFEELKFLGDDIAVGKSKEGYIKFVNLTSKEEINATSIDGLRNMLSLKLEHIHPFTDMDVALIYKTDSEFLMLNSDLKISGKFNIPDGYEIQRLSETDPIGYRNKMISLRHKSNYSILLMNTKLKEIGQYGKSKVGYFNEGMAFIIQDNEVGLANSKGVIIVKPKYRNDYKSDYKRFGFKFSWENLVMSDNLFPVKNDDKYGFINKKGDRVIGYKYDFATPFVNEEATVVYKGTIRKIGVDGKFTDRNSNTIANSFGANNKILDYVKSQTGQVENYISVRIGNEFSSLYLTDNNINLKYFPALERTKEVHHVLLYKDYQMSELIGGFFINNDGEIQFDKVFENVTAFEDGYAGIKQNDKWSFINNDFENIFVEEYDSLQQFVNGEAAVKIKDEWNIINTNGTVIRKGYPKHIIDCQYMVDIVYFGNRRPPDPYNDKTYVSKRKTFLDQPLPLHPATLTEELNLVGFKGMDTNYMVKGKMGYFYVRKDATVAFPYYYAHAGKFFNKMARVENNYGKVGFIDTEGKEIIPVIFDETGTIHYKEGSTNKVRNYIIVKLSDKYGAYTPDGKEILKPRFDKIYDEYSSSNTNLYKDLAKYNFIWVEKNGHKYYVNLEGQCMKNCP